MQKIIGSAAAVAGVTLPTAMTRLSLAGAASNNDPNSRLASAVSDGGDGSGIQMVLTDGWSTTDPLDCPYLVFNPVDIEGNAFEDADNFDLRMQLIVRTEPGITTDTFIFMGIINEDVDSVTVDGIFHGLGFSGSNRQVRMHTIANGTVTGASTNNANVRHMLATFFNRGTGTVGYSSSRDGGVDSAMAYLGGAANQASTVSIGSGAKPRIVVGAGRSAVTAGQVTLAFDLYYQKTYSVPLKT